MPTLDQTVDAYAQAFRTSRERAHALTEGLTDDGFNWKPDTRAWSAGECLIHLNVVAEGHLPALEAAFEAAPPRGQVPAPIRYGLSGRVFVAMSRPGSLRIPTFPSMKPPPAPGGRSAAEPAETLAAFDRYTDRFLALTERARVTDLGRVSMRDPYVPLARIPLAAFLDGLGLHALRHVGQAERVAAHPSFPRADRRVGFPIGQNTLS